MLGIFSIIEPAFAGLGVTLLVGWLLLFGATAHFIGAWARGGAKQVTLQLFAAFYFVSRPLLGVRTPTLVLATVIVSVGVVDLISYFRLEDAATSG